MPESQQQRAAESSARIRVSRRLLRELRNTRPLTAEQRAEVIAAAASIKVTTGYAGAR